MRASALTGSRMRTLRGEAAAALLITLTAVALAEGPAFATSCVSPEDAIPDTETAFVGTAVEQRQRHARVDVDEVWRGPDLAPTVWVKTAPGNDLGPLSSFFGSSSLSNAQLEPGRRYIIASDGRELRTNVCLVAQASEPLVEHLAPETTREPIANGTTGVQPLSSNPAAIAGIGLTLIAVASAGSWLAYRRHRSRHA